LIISETFEKSLENIIRFYHRRGHLKSHEYLKLPKGDITTPTWGCLLGPYTIIIRREKNFYRHFGVGGF